MIIFKISSRSRENGTFMHIVLQKSSSNGVSLPPCADEDGHVANGYVTAKDD